MCGLQSSSSIAVSVAPMQITHSSFCSGFSTLGACKETEGVRFKLCEASDAVH